MGILWYGLVLWLGGIIGFLIRSALFKFRETSGTIYVTKEDEKTLYSLELDEYPESLEFKKEVVFRIDKTNVTVSEPDIPEQSLDRE